MEQYRDGNIGFSAHTKLPSKDIKLKNIPKTGDGTKYTSADEKLAVYREFLSHIMHISPQCSIVKTTGDDFENGRVVVTPYDLYEAFRLISRIPKDNSMLYNTYNKYLAELYDKRDDLFPSGESTLPKYIKSEDIPNPNGDFVRYNNFFEELKASVKRTLIEALDNSSIVGMLDESNLGDILDLNNDEDQISHDEH